MATAPAGAGRVTVRGLAGGRRFWVSLRAHAASAVSLATGWTNLSGSFACTTPTGLPAEPGAPRPAAPLGLLLIGLARAARTGNP